MWWPQCRAAHARLGRYAADRDRSTGRGLGVCPQASTPAAGPTGAVRLGFAPDAKAVFEKLPAKVHDGLRRKLRDFGANPAVSKPLVCELQGYYRVTYGRMRSIAEVVAETAEGVVVVHVVYIGLRKEGSARDPYEVAAMAALQRADPDAVALMETLVYQVLRGPQPPDTDNE